MTQHMLTTVDNPFNPFTDYNAWFGWDIAAGYHTVEFLARIVRTSDDLSEGDQEQAIEQGIDEIVSENVLGVYKKVEEPSSDSE
jgi:hypothetical protein